MREGLEIDTEKSNSECQINSKAILKGNIGFEGLEDLWLPYVASLGIKSVKAVLRSSCPYCSSGKYTSISQYLYYSTLLRLNQCSQCGLIYSNALLNNEVTSAHFEDAYKDQSYFHYERAEIFKQISEIVRSQVRLEGRILDVGGATGVLSLEIKNKRPDLHILVNDLSESACEIASRGNGLESLQGRVQDIPEKRKFDVILLIDVLYYETDLADALIKLHALLENNGMLIFRGPNKCLLMKATLFIKNIFKSRDKIKLERRTPFFNPEHLYVLHQAFMMKAFKEIGFSDVKILPASSLKKKYDSKFRTFVYRVLSLLCDISSFAFFKCFSVITSPSYVLIARK